MLDVSHNIMELSKNDPKTLKSEGFGFANCPTQHRTKWNKQTTLKFFKITSFYWLFQHKRSDSHKTFYRKAARKNRKRETTGKPPINKRYFISL